MKTTNFTNFLKYSTLFFIFGSATLFAATNCPSGSTAECKYGVTASELAAQIQGVGITITNPQIKFADDTQVGIFSDGINGANLEINEGIILTAMTVKESFTTNSSKSTSKRHGKNRNDPDLLAIDNHANNDTVVFEFDVTLDDNTRLLLVDYQFASEEYNEFVGTRFNDAFGFFISGGDLNETYNIARVVDNQTYVTIDNIDNYDTVTVNNVNNGVSGTEGYYNQTYPETNSQYYIDNTHQHNDNKPPILVEYDGLTHKLHATLDNLTPGQTYHFKMALADTGDQQWDTGVFVNKINGLREPSICYDYAYKQNGLYLTEGYDASEGPYINADVRANNPSQPVELAMYFRNMKDSEIVASNIFFNLIDINTTQATYHRESVWVTEPNSFTRKKVNDSSLNVSDSYIKGIPISSFDAYDYFYIYASLDPKTSPLRLPIKARIDYDLTIPLSENDSITIQRSSFIDKDVPICSGGVGTYAPVYGYFNVIENGLYTNESNYYYNINTQVTNRRGNLSVVSIDTNTTSNPDLHTLKKTSTVVGIDMLDLKSFHYTTATCSEVTNSISDRIWVVFSDESKVPLIPDTITFNKIAREDAAFRVSYNLVGEDGDILQLETLDNNGNKRYNLLNLPDDEKAGTCNNSSDRVSTHCTTEGTPYNSAMTKNQLDSCMECLYGINTKLICSRDNFAIRPEAFTENIFDQNGTTQTTIDITPKYSGEITTNNTPVDLAAGYNYLLEINATSHIDNEPSQGYNVLFNDKSGTSAHYVWTPSSVKTSCIDTQDKNATIKALDGLSDENSSLSQVGEYKLVIKDSSWADIDKIVQTHHTGAYFKQTPDCTLNSSNVAKESQFDNFNGCNISSTHTNLDNNRSYIDLNIMMHPYEFDLSNVTPSVGLSHDANITKNTFIYMSNLNNTVDENMSFHLNGNIKAVGADKIVTTNFVDGCYAEPLNAKIEKSTINLPASYQYKLHILDENSTQIREEFKDLNNTTNSIALPATDFIPTAKGEVKTILNLNYSRDVNKAINPEIVTLNSYKIECQNAANCAYTADLNTSNATQGKKDLNYKIRHYYGRTHTPRQKYIGADGDAFIYYEVYCDLSNDGNKSLLQDEFNSKYTDDPRWYVNTKHKTLRDGQVNAINQKGYAAGSGNVNATTIDTATPTKAHLHYGSASTKGYPYKATMETNASGWLIYNKYNKDAKKNEFEVEFINSSGAWAGERETDSTTKKNAADITNRRLMW
jgi:hypothetical protein